MRLTMAEPVVTVASGRWRPLFFEPKPRAGHLACAAASGAQTGTRTSGVDLKRAVAGNQRDQQVLSGAKEQRLAQFTVVCASGRASALGPAGAPVSACACVSSPCGRPAQRRAVASSQAAAAAAHSSSSGIKGELTGKGSGAHTHTGRRRGSFELARPLSGSNSLCVCVCV